MVHKTQQSHAQHLLRRLVRRLLRPPLQSKVRRKAHSINDMLKARNATGAAPRAEKNNISHIYTHLRVKGIPCKDDGEGTLPIC